MGQITGQIVYGQLSQRENFKGYAEIKVAT
jgi:hypothetical protein